jgi:DNA-binding NtrC family response regulator
LNVENLVILIVEDHSVRESLEQLVERRPNVDVISADNFFSAAIWINAVPRIDLLLCDFLLPGQMTGVDVADVAVLSHPAIAVVIISSDARSEIAGMRDTYAFIRKPFVGQQLSAHIDKAFLKLHPLTKPIL